MVDLETRSELRQLAILLIVDVAFYFLAIPAGILDPEGMSMDQGLPPSFAAKLVAILAGALMVSRCLQLVFFGRPAAPELIGDSSEAPEITADDDAAPAGVPQRGLLGMLAGLAFAYVLTPVIGFFPAGFVLLVVLLRVLGENRPAFLFLPPVIVSVLVWGLFEQLLSIRLPDGMLFGG